MATYNKTAPFGDNIAKELEKQNRLLAMMVEEHITETANWQEIGEIVRKGLAPDVFSIGDQLVVDWKDGETTYKVPMDIVHFGDVELHDGEVVPAMFLQWHYCSPFGVQFDGNEAFYVPTAELPAGTYHFTIGNNWGTHCVSGKVYQFTTTKAVPVGGQLQLGTASSETSGLPDTAPNNWRVRTYDTQSNATPLEVLTLTEGSGGTDLGVLSSSTKYGLSGMNNMQRSAYGYNRWSQSGIRQYLNSKNAKSAWWTPQNPFDRAPSEHLTKDGFLAGFGDDFLAQLKPIKITTALNTVTDGDFGATEDTYDTFFLASKRNENMKEQLANVEGDIWEYWYRATNGVKPNDYETGAFPVTYAINGKTSPQNVRVRSAYRGSAYNTWSVGSSGNVYYSTAPYSYRFAPACAIC